MQARSIARLALTAATTLTVLVAGSGVAMALPLPFDQKTIDVIIRPRPPIPPSYYRRWPIFDSCSTIEAQYADAQPTPDNVAHLEEATVCLVNDFRVSHGVPALTVDPNLTNGARAHSQDMVNRHYFSHDHPAGTAWAPTYYPGGWAENIAYGPGSYGTPRAIVNGPVCGWTTEPHTSGPCGPAPGAQPTTGHRDNILNASLTKTGVGVAFGTPMDSSTGGTYTQDFGGSPR